MGVFMDNSTLNLALFKNSPQPYFVQIKYYLRELIKELPPDSLLPSEHEIAAAFQVSRGTASRAIMDLVYEGVLYRKKGIGTFTASKLSRSYDVLPSFTKDIARMHHTPTREVLSFKVDVPAPRASSFFGIDHGIIRYKRLIKDNGNPVAIVISYLNPKIYIGLEESDIGSSLYDSLNDKYHLVPSVAKDSYSLSKISKKTAGLLQVSYENNLVVYSERQAYLNDMTPVEFVESYIRTDRFKLVVDYHPAQKNSDLTSIRVNYESS